MAYSESLFTALAAWSLYAVLTGRWVTAGVLASLSGLTRPVGLAVVAAVWAAGSTSLLRDRRPPGTGPFVRTRGTALVPGAHGPGHASRPSAEAASGRGATAHGPRVAPRALGMLLAPLGAAGYVLWVGHRTGRGPLGYLDVQAGWRNGFDGGYAFARFVADKFTAFPSALAGVGLIVGVALLLLAVRGLRTAAPAAGAEIATQRRTDFAVLLNAPSSYGRGVFVFRAHRGREA